MAWGKFLVIGFKNIELQAGEAMVVIAFILTAYLRPCRTAKSRYSQLITDGSHSSTTR